jgi:quercetin dioxygenase-like cupin family protein
MQRTLVLSAVLVLGVCGVWIHGAQQSAPPAQPFNTANFTGTVTPHPTADIRTSRNHFAVGARSNWHSHQGGQVIFVEEGRLRTQERGQAIRELGTGESFHTSSGIVHWHGALPGTAVTQIALSFGMTTWLEKVSDEEYARGVKR